MTDDRMALKSALEKASDIELLSPMLGFVADKLMALDVDYATHPATNGPEPGRTIATAIANAVGKRAPGQSI